MAKAVPLPRQDALPEGVIFHREHPAEPRLVLQIPNAQLNDSETYVVKLDDPTHKAWFEALKNHSDLSYQLGMDMHVAFCPRTGHVQPLKDVDEPSPMAFAMAMAHYFGAPAKADPAKVYFQRKDAEARMASTQARAAGFSGPVSALRRILGGR
jgi:hypothetical protein